MSRISGRAALVFLLACTLYLNSLGHDFHYDDFHSIVDNPHIRSLDGLAGFFRDPKTFSAEPENAMYRPVLLLSYAVNYAFGQDQPRGYHLVNVALHGANAALVFLLLLTLCGNRRMALIAAVFFAVNPLHAESVNYVSSRSVLLMACFFLLACLAYIRFGRTRSWFWFSVALVSAALALLTKSVAVVLVVILVLCDWFLQGRQGWLRHWKYYLAFVGIDLCYILFTRQLIGKAVLAPIRSLDIQAWTQIKAAAYYILLAWMPVRLSVEHQFFPALRPQELAVLGALLGVLSLLFLVVYRGDRVMRFSFVWCVAVMLPTAVVPLVVLVNEHRLYLAGVGLSLVLARALYSPLVRRKRMAMGVIAVYTIILVALTLQRNQVWANELSLWQDAAIKGPLMVKPHLRLGDALAGLDGRQEEAEESYLRAVKLRPQHPGTRNNLGLLYLKQGRLVEAESQFRALLQPSPDIVPTRLNLARALMLQGNWQEAASEYHQVLEFSNTGGIAQGYLGHIALKYQGDAGGALKYYEKAVALATERDKVPALLVGRGAALKGLQRFDEAEACYKKVLQLDSTYVDAWFNLGNLYLGTQRRAEAVAAYEQVVEIDTDAHLTSRANAQLNHLIP